MQIIIFVFQYLMNFMRLKIVFSIPLFLLIIILVFSYVYVSINARKQIYSSVKTIPYNKTALLLGTSKYMNNGKVNLFFTHRCNAAIELWENGNIENVIISGDSTSRQYDEPELMRKELVENGMPDSLIVLDKKGYNTRASVLFCKRRNIEMLTIVSQQFHNERAIVLADAMGINAIAYNAKPVYASYGIRVWIREWFARVKLVFVN